MRNLPSALAISVIGAGIIFAPPAALAQGRSDTSPPSPHVRQHQAFKPSPRDQTTPRDQSAQAPQSPAVIKPPATGDHSVITPPATGAAKMPVIPPPGTPGGDNNVEPK